VLGDLLVRFPQTDPVVFWRDADTRRTVLDVDWYDTKSVLSRVLVSYRSRSSLHSLVSGDLSERGACTHFRTASGHYVGLVRPTMLIDSFASDEPVLLAREDGGSLSDAVIVADLDDARRTLRSWTDEGLTDPRSWRAYLGERGESRADLLVLEALSNFRRSCAKTELEVAVRVALARRNRQLRGAA
jgi:hypothetical protein